MGEKKMFADRTMVKAYIIKYALTSGIFLADVEANTLDAGAYVYRKESIGFSSYKLGRDAFLDKDEAIAAAKKLRDRKVASVERQLANLKKMEFLKYDDLTVKNEQG